MSILCTQNQTRLSFFCKNAFNCLLEIERRIGNISPPSLEKNAHPPKLPGGWKRRNPLTTRFKASRFLPPGTWPWIDLWLAVEGTRDQPRLLVGRGGWGLSCDTTSRYQLYILFLPSVAFVKPNRKLPLRRHEEKAVKGKKYILKWPSNSKNLR